MGRKRSFKPKSNFERDDGTYTQTEEETDRYLLEKYFPKDDVQEDNEEMTEIRTRDVAYNRQDEPEIVKEEVEEIVRALKKGKATPHTDRVPNEAVRHIMEAVGDLVIGLYNECWTGGVFQRI